ncbi:MAG TPA: 4-(cytidine 5'-diphospho)-2-C-methyl-D-erythritol kinase, partial [Ktedonobacterales bacterium]
TITEDAGIACETDMAALRTEHNLALRAARLLAATLPEERRLGVRIELRKGVPAQGGLGGGSSDAAIVLATLNALWRAGQDTPALERLAAELGSDVPFFIRGGTSLIEGRGERVTPLPDAAPLWLVLAKPPVNISTPTVFRALSPAEYHSGEASAAAVAAIRAGQPVPEAALVNSLEPGVLRTYPAVAETREALLAAGAPLVRMSGSGPTLYAPFAALTSAAAVYERARATGLRVWLCHTVSAAAVARSRPDA